VTTPHIDHIGIIVADLELAAARLLPLFGECGTIRELPEVGLRVAEFHAANVVIELLQYTTSGDPGFARGVMGERLGLNHISARVDDVDRSVAELTQAGFSPMPGFPRQGSHGRVAFFEPDRLTGLLFEVCQPNAGEDGGHGK
jgi:catechol 2,3-dioxygenase-like lactoylglutathione lyase family enzyme